ncbi:MAG: GGDEF domain-containing protein, partial [Candidatus Izemoplasmatales bacterium]|nr:GGDEF domain-containing protein [Candidatus Izemoplasmatales bacterium]
HGVFGAGFSHLIFIMGQFKYQTNPDILAANIINASLVVVCASILSYFFYHNYATLTLKSLELEESTKKLRILSITDPLTGLFNRRHFYSQAEQVKLNQQVCGIILFDLDAFKSINDTYGHVVGDEMLVLFSSLLQAKTKADDFAVRWGGEEFLLLLMRDSAEEIEKDVQEILLACEETYSTTLSRPVKLTASAGVLLCHSYNYNHIDDYVSDADEALYQSKEAGGNRSTIVEKK